MTDNELAETVGPCWTTDKVAAELRVEAGELPDLRAEGKLLGVRTSDDVWLYPVFQFVRSGGVAGVRVGVATVLDVLRHVDPWAVAVLIKSTPAPEFDGLTPLEVSQDARRVEELHTFAARVLREWTA